MSTVTEIPDLIHAQVSSVSRQLRSKYRDFCEYEDIQQELYIWYIKHHTKVEKWEEELHEKSVARLVAKSLRNAGERYCRRQKAMLTGYEPEDEFFYTIPMVTDMLQLYFDPEWMEPRAIELTTSSSGKAPNEGWNLQAMVADVGRGYESLSASDQHLLREVFGGEVPVRDAIAWYALEWGITENAADHRIRRIVGRIRAKLGGPRPYIEREDAE